MPRALPGTYTENMAAVSPQPITLFEIATGLTASGYETIRVTSYDQDIKFPSSTGSTFYSRPIGGGDFTIKPGDLGPTEITFPDVDGYFETFLAATDFQWQKFKRYYIDYDSSADVNAAQLDVWRIQNVSRGAHEVTFTVVPLLAVLNVAKVPQRTMTKSQFPGIPREGTIR